MFIPNVGTKEYRVLTKKMKDAASKDKIEWLYVNRIVLCITIFIASVFLIGQLHQIVINNVFTDPTVTFNVLGEMDEKDTQKAQYPSLQSRRLSKVGCPDFSSAHTRQKS